VRRRAAAVVFRLGRDGQKAAPLLVELLRDEDPNVRFWAAKALGEIGPAAQPARGPLRDCFGDPDADVRWQAIVSLRHIDGNSPEFLAALAALRQDPHPTVRKLVEEILSPTAPKPPAPRPN
jgi:HEAT repeat protein